MNDYKVPLTIEEIAELIQARVVRKPVPKEGHAVVVAMAKHEQHMEIVAQLKIAESIWKEAIVHSFLHEFRNCNGFTEQSLIDAIQNTNVT